MPMKPRSDSMIRRWALTLMLLSCQAIHVGAHAAENVSTELRQLQQVLAEGNTMERLNGLNKLADIGNASHTAWVFPLLQDPDPQLRHVAQAVIWNLWGHSGDAATDAQFQEGLALMSAGDLAHAIDVFSHLIAEHPLFVEAWNKRATLYFMLGQFDLSIQDCEEVLKLEPRHFGALSGYARMLIIKGQYERALDYMERANQVNPQMPNAEEIIRYLRQQLWGRRNNSV